MLGSVWALDGGLVDLRGSREVTSNHPPLVSLHEFWSNSTEEWDFQISRDGKQLAWLGDYKEEAAILYRNFDQSQVNAIRLARPVETFWWAEDNRHIFFEWDEYGDENFHLLMADTQNPEAAYRDLTPHPGVLVIFHQQLPADLDHLIIQHNRRDRALFDLYRLNITTLEEILIAENPGDVLDWITNPHGELLARRRQLDQGGWQLDVYDRDTDAWHSGFSGEDDDEFSVVGFPLGTKDARALSSRGRDRTSLVRIDLETGREEILYEHPEVDVEYAWVRDDTNQAMFAWVCPDYCDVQYFEPELEDIANRFATGSRKEVEISDWSRDEKIWIVRTESDTAGPTWYSYDKESQETRTLFRSELTSHRANMAPIQPIEFVAQDGLPIHGYLTIPVGSTGTHLPMVVKVHDGPWDRTYWGFDEETQFLANRGYAVLDVNFRGSSGYGRSFMQAGIGEFGNAMHSDILDAVAWAVAKGVADPDRIALYGWGYGGYEALVGVSFTPDVFAAAIAVAGTSNWEKTLASLPTYMLERKLDLQTYVGDPSTPEGIEELRDASPIHQIDDVVRPLFVVQGENDVWGIQDEVEEMVERLRSRDATVEYLVLENEGRSIQNWENQLRFYRALESFLAKHLGGRVSPITADEMWIGVK